MLLFCEDVAQMRVTSPCKSGVAGSSPAGCFGSRSSVGRARYVPLSLVPVLKTSPMVKAADTSIGEKAAADRSSEIPNNMGGGAGGEYFIAKKEVAAVCSPPVTWRQAGEGGGYFILRMK